MDKKKLVIIVPIFVIAFFLPGLFGDLLPFLDPSKSLFLTLAYEKVISEANIMNYD